MSFVPIYPNHCLFDEGTCFHISPTMTNPSLPTIPTWSVTCGSPSPQTSLKFLTMWPPRHTILLAPCTGAPPFRPVLAKGGTAVPEENWCQFLLLRGIIHQTQ